jgi:hypothetical protein
MRCGQLHRTACLKQLYKILSSVFINIAKRREGRVERNEGALQLCLGCGLAMFRVRHVGRGIAKYRLRQQSVSAPDSCKAAPILFYSAIIRKEHE